LSTADLDSQPEYNFGGHPVKNSGLFYRSALSFAFVNRKPVVPGRIHFTMFILKSCHWDTFQVA